MNFWVYLTGSGNVLTTLYGNTAPVATGFADPAGEQRKFGVGCHTQGHQEGQTPRIVVAPGVRLEGQYVRAGRVLFQIGRSPGFLAGKQNLQRFLGAQKTLQRFYRYRGCIRHLGHLLECAVRTKAVVTPSKYRGGRQNGEQGDCKAQFFHAVVSCQFHAGLCCRMALFRRSACFLLFLLWTGWAFGCAICAPDDAQKTLVRQLAAADRIVLMQSAHGVTPIPAPVVVRGTALLGGLPTIPTSSPIAPLRADDLQLLVMNPGESGWTLLGYLPAARAAWLLRLAGMLPPAVGSAPDMGRARFFIRDLEDAYPLVAQADYEEVAVQPYAVLRSLATEVDARQLARWVQDSTRTSRWPLYYLLLGLTGMPRMQSPWSDVFRRGGRSAAPPGLSAMLAALVALREGAGLAWLEQQFLTSQSTPDAQVQAALLALSVHGADGVAISKDQIVAAYGRFIARNPQRAGFVASDLANWGRWEFAEAFGVALRSGEAQVFASRYAIVFYLLRNPRPRAKALVETLRAEKLM